MFFGFGMGISSIPKLPLSVFGIILNLKPVLVIILGVIFGIERITLKKLGYIFLSFLGAGLIVNPTWFASVFSRLFLREKIEETSYSNSETIHSKFF